MSGWDMHWVYGVYSGAYTRVPTNLDGHNLPCHGRHGVWGMNSAIAGGSGRQMHIID